MRQYQLYIAGQWRDGRAGRAAAISPASGEAFARVAAADPADVDDAVAAAAAAGEDWAGSSPFRRAEWCDAVVAGIGRRRDELARALTEDQGKPLLAESFDEVDELAGTSGWPARTPSAAPARCPSPPPPSAGSAARVPLGVVAVVSPWNWPYTMGAEIRAAMAAETRWSGCPRRPPPRAARSWPR